MLVAHPHLRSVARAGRQQHRGHSDHHRGGSPVRQTCHPRPHRPQQIVACQRRPPLRVVHLEVREQHRQQRQVGENDRGDSEARGDRDLLDDLHLDERDGDEADGVGGERHRARQQQAAEARPRGVEAARAVDRLRAHRAHHLHSVADPDREHQERHQDGHRIDPEAQRGDPRRAARRPPPESTPAAVWSGGSTVCRRTRTGW